LIHERFLGFTSQEEHKEKKKIEILINKNYLVNRYYPKKEKSLSIKEDINCFIFLFVI